ncbi:MAG: response regulator [bacterium]|nr:response regulator [bacterium]
MKKILIADDEQTIIMIVKKVLETSGFEVLVAEDGVQALELIFKEKPDLVLADLMMPKMSGYRLIETLRENVETKRLPVIILTAKAWKEDLEKGIRCGADAFITKPFDPFDLVERVKRILEEKEGSS